MSFTTRARQGLAGIVATALTAAGMIALASPSQAAETEVSGVQFRWGFNNESGNTGAAPATVNLFSAGRLGNPGEGGRTLSSASLGATWNNGAAAGWSAAAGNVRIEKKQADDAYATATWAGLRTTKNGAPLGNYAANTQFSDHQVVIDDGVGTVDADANDATISWDGDFTVAYYSGMTFFYVSDPTLQVVNGVGTLKATLSGYGTSQADPTIWESLEPSTVTLATLDGVDVTADGVVTTPKYAGVTYSGTADTVPQSPSDAPHFGSFPTPFVDYLQRTGAGPYWYSTGGSIDKNKHALPLTVDLDPAPPVTNVASRVTASSPRVTYGKGGSVSVAVTAPGVTPAGTVSLAGVGATRSATLVNGRATFALPKNLAVRSYNATLTYAGSPGVTGSSVRSTVSVGKAPTARPTVKVSKRPTSKKKGKATVTVKSGVKGLTPTGKVRITVTKGKSTKRINATLRKGKASVSLPKLKKGTWKLKVTYNGSATQGKGTSKTYKVKSST